MANLSLSDGTIFNTLLSNINVDTSSQENLDAPFSSGYSAEQDPFLSSNFNIEPSVSYPPNNHGNVYNYFGETQQGLLLPGVYILFSIRGRPTNASKSSIEPK